jgi:hypothetical protein
MMIQINPRHIRNSGNSGKANERRKISDSDDENIIIPAKAQVDYVPSPESLRTMISSAVASLRKGVRWDRGTILNLLV